MVFSNQKALYVLFLTAFMLLLLFSCATTQEKFLLPTHTGIGYQWIDVKQYEEEFYPEDVKQMYVYRQIAGKDTSHTLGEVSTRGGLHQTRQVAVADHAVFFTGGKRIACIAFKAEKTDQYWQVLTYKGDQLIDSSAHLDFLPTKIDSLSKEEIRVSGDLRTIVVRREKQ